VRSFDLYEVISAERSDNLGWINLSDIAFGSSRLNGVVEQHKWSFGARKAPTHEEHLIAIYWQLGADIEVHVFPCAVE